MPRAVEPLAGHPRYQKLRDLNKGTFGFVQLALDKLTNTQVAIKFIERGDKISKYVEREIINHKRLNHPHIVELKEVFLTPEYLAIAMEYAAGGDMFQLVVRQRGLPEADARWYFQQLIIAMDYCHRMGVANRDIKLENTLLDGTTRPLIKICDFGYSKHEKFQSAPGSRVGTPAYLAPEVILTTKGKTYDGKVADVWSCGVMLYIMLAAAYPFGRPEDERLKPSRKMHVMLQRILNVEYGFPSHVRVSDPCKDLLARILVADPSKRITVPEILEHPWFKTDLPEGVSEMNDRLVAEAEAGDYPPGVQSMAETERIVREAMQPANAQAINFDSDDFIDEAITEARNQR
jgi:serine/threonine-protein kinase SRK2